MSVPAYQDILAGPLATYCELSKKIGGDVATHAQLVAQAFHSQLEFLELASRSKAPANQNETMRLLQPTADKITAICSLRDKNRASPYFNHLSAISESIPALGWVNVTPAPSPYVKEMNDAGQFYTNRVLKDWKEKDKTHVEWVRSWVETLVQLQQYVKQYHTTGLVWSGKNGIAPAPPGPPPPPMALPAFTDLTIDNSKDRSALFAEINQGEKITSSLKKVTSNMQTHKNPSLRSGPAPFKATPNNTQVNNFKSSVPAEKPPVFKREGKKWIIEYQKNNPSLVVEGAEMNNVVYMFGCVNSTLTVKGKINSVVLDSCKKSSVVFDTLVSSAEFINCQSVQMQVLGKVPTISIDKTDGCQMYLSKDSLDVVIVSSKSSEMNVLVPKPNGDYSEYPVPEQFRTTISGSKGLVTEAVENKG
ncbi:unnamed protein product [Bemisia tabaci]|uniref:Adenylyl cyclase-associated protein n=1 Tax=Bemisia tabaci TaxID=7038 RepID=A0A9P0A2S8_BEMTA|nr:PREDICTED: adenylyl cyclase-associated protein 1 [Bemisia tabaci]CAH0382227.1 unnamed protein product [Bemisia tabaci]